MSERIAKYDSLTKICQSYHRHNLSAIYPSHFANASMVKHILEVAPNLTDVFEACYIHGRYVQCSKLFDKVLTNEGLCFNMNSLAATDIFRTTKLQRDYEYLYTLKPIKGWSVEDGYPCYEIDSKNETDPEFYPAPGAENGDRPDVEVVLHHKDLERDHLCNGINSGYKVYIQHPSDLPQSSLYYYAVLNNQVSSMALSVSILSTSETLKEYDPEVRQCYFPNERYLKYFKLYTSDNCRLECMSNIGCVDVFNSICHVTSSSQKICTQLNNVCISRAKRLMLRQERSKKGGPKCHCLPACNSVDYEAEILKTDFNLKQMLNTYMKNKNMIKGVNFSKLEMYFKRPRFLSMRRSELYGLIDFLSNCGGLLGLFLGFSFLSLIEIFYFLSLRLCCTLKKDLEEEKAQDKNSKETIHDDKTIHVDKY